MGNNDQEPETRNKKQGDRNKELETTTRNSETKIQGLTS